MLTTFLLTMRATPYYYNGDELGMNNIRFECIDDYRDIETLNMYRNIASAGGNLKRFLEHQKTLARDNGRTPFQWDDSEFSGFSTKEPWLKVNPNYVLVNAKVQENEPDSVLNYFRRAVRLRKHELALVYGDYVLLDRGNPSVYAYLRVLADARLLVLLNFTERPATAVLDDRLLDGGVVLLGNYAGTAAPCAELRPYEALVIRLKSPR